MLAKKAMKLIRRKLHVRVKIIRAVQHILMLSFVISKGWQRFHI